jgi:16S rRNA (uracil1498-N3)-methyltransferase
LECFVVDPSDVDTAEGILTLRGDEAHHAAKALRLRVGETFGATNLCGCCYRATVQNILEEKKESVVIAKITETFANNNDPEIDVILVQAMLSQASKFEEIVERCTELGVSGFIPVVSERVERSSLKKERIERLLKVGCKQTFRATIPTFAEISSLEEVLSELVKDNRKIVVLHEAADNKQTLHSYMEGLKREKIALLIGPEGGFTDREVALSRVRYGAIVASLGKRRLRAETAAITAAAVAMSFE